MFCRIMGRVEIRSRAQKIKLLRERHFDGVRVDRHVDVRLFRVHGIEQKLALKSRNAAADIKYAKNAHGELNRSVPLVNSVKRRGRGR